MFRLKVLAVASVAFLGSAMFLHAQDRGQDRGQDRTQPGNQGLEFKGQVQIGVHKAKLEANTLYQVVVGHPQDAPVYVNTDYVMRLATVYSKDFKDNKIYCVPPKSGEYTFTVSPQVGGTPKSGTIDYTLSLKPMPFDDRLALDTKGNLTDKSPKYKNGDKYYEPYKLQMSAGKVYVIDLVKDGVRDPYLYLENAKGDQVASDDDGGGDLNARIIFSPPQDGEYTILASTLGKETGGFKLTVRTVK
ncbi:MAG TPA: hypothetical protein VE988_03970 [Gemmataceae bacterium]|nr:hypothetical protein [Gemmataceae bacterium]